MANIVINQDIEFWEEKGAWQGVKRVAGYVRNDMEKVFGKKPAICEDGSPKSQTVVLYGTIGKSKRLDMLKVRVNWTCRGFAEREKCIYFKLWKTRWKESNPRL